MKCSIRWRWSLLILLVLMLTGLVSSAVLVSAQNQSGELLDCQVASTDGDRDGDGLSNRIEKFAFPLQYLKNEDGQPISVKTESENPDTDGDGICDGEEFFGFTIVTNSTGPDGKPIELSRKTNPAIKDTDGDGYSDGEERVAGTDPRKFNDHPRVEATPTPTSTSQATPISTPEPTPTPTPTPNLSADGDKDGLTDGAELTGFTIIVNGEERFVFTNPEKRDTDGDRLTDGDEVNGFTIKIAGIDRTVKTDPTKADSDGDGKNDLDEIRGWAMAGTTGATKVVTDPTRADTDGDGTTDEAQAKSRRDPTEKLLLEDPDQDGLSSGQELNGSKIMVEGLERVVKTDPSVSDTDGDTLLDGDEVNKREISVNGQVRHVTSDPSLADTDKDGLSDKEEVVRGMDGSRADTDGDRLSDADEIKGFDITVIFMGGRESKRKVYPDPLNIDFDDDGLKDDAEKTLRTDPGLADSDGDGLSDVQERDGIPFNGALQFTNPTKADSDADGLSDGLELSLGTNPMEKDSDSDGLTDWAEVAGTEITMVETSVVMWSNPMSKDSDADGLGDFKETNGFGMTIGGDEVTVYTNPSSADTDADGLSDSEELKGSKISVNGAAVQVFSNPSVRDTDGDYISDRDELQGYTRFVANLERQVRTNPENADTDGDGKTDHEEKVGWKLSVKGPSFKTDPTLVDTDGDGMNDFDPADGTAPDKNPEEANKGIAGIFLGPLLANGIPHSVVVLLVLVAGASAFIFVKLSQDNSGDSAQRRLRDQGRDLERSAREIGQLRGEVEDKDQQLRNLETQLQTYQGTAQHRDQELRTAATRLGHSADELGERGWVAEIVTNLPDSNQPGNGLDDRFTVLDALRRRLEEIRGQASPQRGRVRDLIADLQRVGLETGGIRQAIDNAPATALPSIIASLQEIVQQHTVESVDRDRLMFEIQRAEGLCNRDITDSVGRRVPLQFLARARELLEQATSQAEMNAALIVGDRILDDIYRFYFPRTSR